MKTPWHRRPDLLRWLSDGRGHVAIGLIAAVLLVAALHAIGIHVYGLPLICGAALGSLLPDADSPYSTLGRRGIRVPFVRHRGPVHTPFIGLLLTLGALVLLPGAWKWAAAGLLEGFLLHLLVDWRRPAFLLWPPRFVLWRGHILWSWPWHRVRPRPPKRRHPAPAEAEPEDPPLRPWTTRAEYEAHHNRRGGPRRAR